MEEIFYSLVSFFIFAFMFRDIFKRLRKLESDVLLMKKELENDKK